jgi:ubiquinone/menaquinone biosynthesis C-methylase UbiE
MSKKIDFKSYYKLTAMAPATETVRAAKNLIKSKSKKAIDLGAGSFKNTKFLLKCGFDVVAVDKSPDCKEYLENIPKEHEDKFKFVLGDLNDELNDTKSGSINLVVAQHVLPFIEPKLYPLVFENIVRVLKTGGILSTVFFDPSSSFNNKKTKGKITFHTKVQVFKLLKKHGLELILERTDIGFDSLEGMKKEKLRHDISIIAIKK